MNEEATFAKLARCSFEELIEKLKASAKFDNPIADVGYFTEAEYEVKEKYHHIILENYWTVKEVEKILNKDN